MSSQFLSSQQMSALILRYRQYVKVHLVSFHFVTFDLTIYCEILHLAVKAIFNELNIRLYIFYVFCYSFKEFPYVYLFIFLRWEVAHSLGC